MTERGRSRHGRDTARADLVAGLTTAALLVPQAMGYATLAGLPPEVGLYASIAPALVYLAIGRVPQLSVGPVAMDSLLVAGALGALVGDDLGQRLVDAAALAAMVGIAQIALGLIRAGFVAQLVSRPVLLGFTSAAGVLIATSQLGTMLGVSLPRTHRLDRVALALVERGDQISWPTLAIGGVSLAAILLAKRRAPRMPAPLLVVVVTTLVAALSGADALGVALVGTVPSGLPPLGIPSVELSALGALAPSALTIALVSFMETLAVGRRIARRHGVDAAPPNRELIAIGAANLAASITGGYPIAGGLSRSWLNDQAGARTKRAALLTAGVVALVAGALTGLLESLPQAALAAVILSAVLGLVDVRAAMKLYRTNRADFALMTATALMTLAFGVAWGLPLGALASVLLFVVRSTTPHFAWLGRIPGTQTYLNLARHPHAERIPGVAILRIDAQLYFGNAAFLKDTVRCAGRDAPVNTLVLEATGVNGLDSTAAETLVELEEELRARGIQLVLTRVKGPVRDALSRIGVLEKWGEEGRILISTHRAVSLLEAGEPLPVSRFDAPDDPRALPDRVGCGAMLPKTP